MSAPMVLALVNFLVMASLAVMGARVPHWSRTAAWLLLLMTTAVLALFLTQETWRVDPVVLSVALLASTCLNAGALAPVVVQRVMARSSRTEQMTE